MPRRRTKKTVFIYCEGAHDKAFLDCLSSVYPNDNQNTDIRRGTGGDQKHLAEEAVKKSKDYDEKYLKVDGDRDATEMSEAERITSDNGLVLLRTTPCIEKLLINILKPNLSITSWHSTRLKSYFQANYIPANKRTNVQSYKHIFTKDILDSAKERLNDLKKIIDIFTE